MHDPLKNYQPRRESKSRKKKFMRWFAISLAALFFLVVIFLVKVLLSWKALEVSGFSISNPTSVPDAVILNSLKDQMLENKLRAIVGPGNILFWGLGTKPSILENLPLLQSVSVNSDILKRSVSVQAIGRTPFGVICEATSTSCFIFDKTGVIFSASPDVEGPLILKVNDFTGRSFLLGENILPDPSWFQNFMNVIETLKENGFVASEIDFNDLSSREWEVKLIQGPAFYFGFNFVPDNLGYILQKLSSRLDFEKATYVDFSVPGRIYYK